MSIAILQNDDSVCPPEYVRVHAHRVRSCTDIIADGSLIGNLDIGNIVPGANGHVLRTEAGVAQWGYVQKNNFNLAGNARDVLQINALNTALEFTDSIQVNNLKTINSMDVPSAAFLVNGVGPVGTSIFFSDGVNQGWVPVSTQPGQASQYYSNAVQDLDGGSPYLIQFPLIGLNQVTDITPNITFDTFTLNNVTNQNLAIEAIIKLQSPVIGTGLLEILKNGIDISSVEINPGDTEVYIKSLSNLANLDFIQVQYTQSIAGAVLTTASVTQTNIIITRLGPN